MPSAATHTACWSATARGSAGAQQRDVERRALRRWQRERGVRAHGLEQVAQGDERQVRLALDGGDGEHAVSARDGGGLRRSPDRGLADAGVALEEERGRRHLHRVHEGRHLRERGVPPEDDGCRVLPEHRRASCRGGGPRVARGHRADPAAFRDRAAPSILAPDRPGVHGVRPRRRRRPDRRRSASGRPAPARGARPRTRRSARSCRGRTPGPVRSPSAGRAPVRCP